MLNEDVIVRTPKACLIWISIDVIFESPRSGTVCLPGVQGSKPTWVYLDRVALFFQQKRNNSSPTPHVLEGLAHAVKS